MLLVDARGVPFSIIVTAANHHDVTQLEPVLNAIVYRRPRSGARAVRSTGKRSDIPLGVGSSRSRTPGSIVFANYWSDMKKHTARISRSTCWPPQLLALVKCELDQILFTDKS